MNRRFCKLPALALGNSLVEYALPLGLIAVVVLIGAGLVGGNLTQWMPSMANGSIKNDGNSKSLRLRPLGSNPFTKTVQVTLSDGTQLQLENYPTDIKSLLETLGPNGTTDLLADSLKALAKQLLAQGKITPDQANQLSNLSNSGHSWAKTLGIFEDAVAGSTADNNSFYSKTRPIIDDLSKQSITVDKIDPVAAKLFRQGDKYPEILLDSNGLALKDANGQFLYDKNKMGKSYLTPLQFEFANAYTEALKSGALQEPVVKQVVEDLSKNIFFIGSGTILTVGRILDPVYQLKPSDFTLNVKQSVDGTASNICDIGGGKDTGISCPGQKQKGS
ncbi:MAG: hypothetical protein K2X66_18680 [Cyanobacteria bacterium]|nr:hypothetical protein [Cyanobacteriota bacterium]